MNVTSTHTRNPAEGWDISASSKAEKAEKIARAQIIVNGSGKYDESFDPPIDNWQETLTQEGQYPGSNIVQVIITNDEGDNTESYDSWS